MVKLGCDVEFGLMIMVAARCFFLCDEIKFLNRGAEWVRCRGNLDKNTICNSIEITLYVVYCAVSIAMRHACAFQRHGNCLILHGAKPLHGLCG